MSDYDYGGSGYSHVPTYARVKGTSAWYGPGNGLDNGLGAIPINERGTIIPVDDLGEYVIEVYVDHPNSHGQIRDLTVMATAAQDAFPYNLTYEYEGWNAHVEWTTGGVECLVYLDGVLIASAYPANTAGSYAVSAGSHTMRFEAEGYESWESTQQVGAGARVSWSAWQHVTPIVGYLNLSSQPDGATVTINAN